MSKSSLLNFLTLPEASQLNDLDDASTTVQHKNILNRKPFLQKIYREYYEQMKAAIGGDFSAKQVVEIGSGAGFIKDIIPRCIASDLIVMDGLDVAFSALEFPFKNDSLDAICMINVLHHLPRVDLFFTEAARCLKDGGKIIMVEPANTCWGKFVYTHFHHEPFDETAGWTFGGGGRLTDANVALPWIVFKRDRRLFEQKYPNFSVKSLKIHTPFRYLLSGGFTMRSLVPSASYPLFKGLGLLLTPLHPLLGMFMTIEIQNKK
jgi:SAM-dependent methyltransferase